MKGTIIWTVLAVACHSAGQELLSDPGLEGRGPAAQAWSALAWGDPKPDFACAASEPHGGARGQRVTVTALPEKSGFVYRQPVTFLGGHTYRGRLWLRSPDRARVQVLMRRAGPHYEPCAARALEAGPEWREVTLSGGFGEGDVPGFFGVAFQSAGTLEIDDASLTDISSEVQSQPTPTNTMDRAFYGLHINKLGSHNVWPALGQGSLRLWDTGTTWSHLEPRPGEWNWTRLDYYVRHAQKHAPECRLILTLGIPPAWACATNARSAYAGCAAPPLDLEAWRRYVRAVGERYKGRIRCWEPWNECDYGGFFNGGPAAMLPLARAAYEELKRIDPQNVVLSPNVTRAGLGWLDAYLGAGGGAWCDVLSFHRYPSGVPENDVPEYFAFCDLARAHGLGDKPLWNTEGAIERRAGEGEAEIGTVARSWLVQWAQGVTAFCWYCWDIHWEKGTALSASLTGEALTPAGQAVAELVRWTDGAVMERREVRDRVWLLSLRRDGRAFWIVWRVGNPQPWTLPPGMVSAVCCDLTGRRLETVDGKIPLGPLPVRVLDVQRTGNGLKAGAAHQEVMVHESDHR